LTERFSRSVEGVKSLAEDAEDERVKPAGELLWDTAELDLELERLPLRRLGKGGDDLRQAHRPRTAAPDRHPR
jgi:hypothetical protein